MRDPGLQAAAPELRWLYQRINYERRRHDASGSPFKLETMRALLRELGDPQNRYPIVHIAGTKGKGSVSAMLAKALTRSGLRTGLYSSPHLESIAERIDLDGSPIGGEELAETLGRVRQAVQRVDAHRHDAPCSFFEAITAAALVYFADRRAQAVVLEVGLGGRLDSTNVCRPELTVITNISIDHTRQLGPTLDRIAGEKAGIIKPGIPVISGVTNEPAADVIRQHAARQGAPLYELDRDFHLLGTRPGADAMGQWVSARGVVAGSRYALKDVWLSAPGRHQAANAAVAIAAFHAWAPRGACEAAMRDALGAFGLIGRFECLSRQPLIVLDMAHNAASIAALVDTLEPFWPGGGRRTLVFASSADKDIRGMLRCVWPVFDRLVLTRFVENPRSVSPEDLMRRAAELERECPGGPRCQVAAGPAQAWDLAEQDLADGDAICITGSSFLVAEMRAPVWRRFGAAACCGSPPAGKVVRPPQTGAAAFD